MKLEEMREKLEEMRLQREDKMRLQKEKEEEMRIKFEEIRTEMEEKKEMRKKIVRREAELLRDLPFVVSCAYQDIWTEEGSVITYDRHIVEFNNSYRPGGEEEGIYLETGRCTVGSGGAGYYTVTYNA